MIKRFNKKGFTLIELLAVIVVLAIIMLLAVQAVLPQMEKARKNAFVVEANAAIEAAQNLVLTKQVADSDFTISKNCVSIETLKNYGYYETNGKDQYTGYVEISRDGSSDNKAGYTYKVHMTNKQYKVDGNEKAKVQYGDVKEAGTTSEITLPTTGCTTISSDTEE